MAVWALALAAGCGGVDPEDLGVHDEPILNGEPVAADTLGVVRLNSSCGGCSGTLLTNDWVLTARHCLNCAAGPGTITLSHGTTGQSRTSTTFFLNASKDVALVHLATPFAFTGGSQPPASINNPIYPWASSGLQGKTLRVDGYGLNTCYEGFGTLRTASLAVASTTASSLTFSKNALDQLAYRGDSGGPTWATVNGKRYVAGVHSYVDHYCDKTPPETLTDVAASAVRTWVNWDTITPNECNAGYGECDGDYASLCETRLSTNVSHCGRCGHACAEGQTCRSGVCIGRPYSWAGCKPGYVCCEPGIGGCAWCAANLLACQ